MRGYFEIGIYNVKSSVNVGTLWRSAYQLGASGIFTIGKRYRKEASDTCKAAMHLPMRHYTCFEEFMTGRPVGAALIGIETGGMELHRFSHPMRAVYLLGAEDHGIPDTIINKCNKIVSLEALRTESYNVSVAGSIVMYHRLLGSL